MVSVSEDSPSQTVVLREGGKSDCPNARGVCVNEEGGKTLSSFIMALKQILNNRGQNLLTSVQI